jgi:transcriptional regulator with XRE-family HTH domain
MANSLKYFREVVLNVTQSEFADKIGELQTTVSKWEKKEPGGIEDLSGHIIIKIATAWGQEPNKLLAFSKPMPRALQVEDEWLNVIRYKENLIACIEDIGKSASPHVLEESKDIVTMSIRKPRIAFVGLSDVGKSTMINALLGIEKKIPAEWTPLTSIVIYVKHVDDRPQFIKDEVCVFTDDNAGFDIDTALNGDGKDGAGEYFNRFLVESGGAELLEKYGTRKGDGFREAEERIAAAAVFVNSPILKNVDLVDLPGFNTGLESDNIAVRGIGQFADVLVYLSRSNGFFSTIEELTVLRQSIQVLPCFEYFEGNKILPLGNLFIVASQAQIQGQMSALEQIMDDGFERFKKTLPESTGEFFMRRSKESGYPSDEYLLRRRYFPYSTDEHE